MNPRERYLETLRFGHPDHVPLQPGGPRESTLAVWHTQGLPEDANWVDVMAAEIGVPSEAFDLLVIGLEVGNGAARGGASTFPNQPLPCYNPAP